MNKKLIIISLTIILILLLVILLVAKLKIDNSKENFIINNSDSASWEISTENVKHSWAWDIN